MADRIPPRGIRGNNPGNIRHGDQWQGMAEPSAQTDKDFVVFTSATWGIRALARTLIAYKDKHNLRTVRKIINRWAPPIENNTGAYIANVARLIGVGPDDQIDVFEYDVMRPLAEAIIAHENGDPAKYGRKPHNNINRWYDDSTVDEGLKMAGVVDKSKTVLSDGEGKGTAVAVGAAGTAGVVTTLAEFGPDIAGHVRAANDATNGLPDWARILVLVLVLVATGAGVYVLVKKRNAQKAVK